MTSPEVISEKCISCGLCAAVCPAFVIEMAEDKAAVLRGTWCIGCGQCGAVCPVEAIVPKGTDLSRSLQSGAASGIAPESLLFLLLERRSVRRYADKPVSRELLERILDAGRYAPTGKNSQNVHYVVLTSPEEIETLQRMTMRFYEKLFSRVRTPLGAFVMSLVAGRKVVESLRESVPKAEFAKGRIEEGHDPLFYHAPAVVLAHAESWDTCSAFNCDAALYNCSLMAHALGMGCCFNGYLVSAANHDRKIRKWLGIRPGHRCYAAMTLGYQDVTYRRLPDREPPKVTWR